MGVRGASKGSAIRGTDRNIAVDDCACIPDGRSANYEEKLDRVPTHKSRCLIRPPRTLAVPRGYVESLKSLFPLRCHCTVRAKRLRGRLTVGPASWSWIWACRQTMCARNVPAGLTLIELGCRDPAWPACLSCWEAKSDYFASPSCFSTRGNNCEGVRSRACDKLKRALREGLFSPLSNWPI